MDTLEQYILKQLTDTQDELNVVKQENKELKEKLSKRKVEELQLEDLPNSKTITISESPNYYYDLVAASGSTINDLLKDNNKTPDFLKQVLEDEESYNEYLDLKSDQGYYHLDACGGEIRRNVYDYLLINYYGKKHVIFSTYKEWDDIRCIDNETCFLDYEKAKEGLKKLVFENIKQYFRCKYDEYFKPKDNVDSSQDKLKNVVLT